MKESARRVIEQLKNHGYSAFIVGGYVRDELMGKTPKDIDIATNATPETISFIFDKTLPIGKKFGVVTVIKGGYQFEVATYRGEGLYTDGRRPDEVFYTNAPQEDCIRRDFTINGMYMDPTSGRIIDYVGGKDDIRNGMIRTIGDPNRRFQEDYLRMLRAVRFATQFHFSIQGETLKAICKNKEKIVEVSCERIRDELNKILVSNSPGYGINLLKTTGLLEHILPELHLLVGLSQGKYHHHDAFQHTIQVLSGTEDNIIHRLGALFHDIGKPKTREPHNENVYSFYYHDEVGADMTVEIMKRLRYSNEEIERVERIVRLHMGLRGGRKEELSDKALRKFARKCGSRAALSEVLSVMTADFCSHPGPDVYKFTELKHRFSNLLSTEQATTTQKVVNGKDIMEFFVLEQGPEVGKILDRVQELLDEDPLRTKEELFLVISRERIAMI